MAGHYDPDRMNSGGIDPDDTEMVDEWLDHPNTVALQEELGRQFRELPAVEQIRALTRNVNNDKAYRMELLEILGDDSAPEDDPRRQLLAHIGRNISAANARIIELGGEPA